MLNSEQQSDLTHTLWYLHIKIFHLEIYNAETLNINYTMYSVYIFYFILKIYIKKLIW